MAGAWACVFEIAACAVVHDVHAPELARAAGLTDNPGSDLLSMRTAGERRPIEVKGRAAKGDVEVTAMLVCQLSKRFPAEERYSPTDQFCRASQRCRQYR